MEKNKDNLNNNKSIKKVDGQYILYRGDTKTELYTPHTLPVCLDIRCSNLIIGFTSVNFIAQFNKWSNTINNMVTFVIRRYFKHTNCF